MDNYGDGGAGSKFSPILIQLALLSTIVGSCISFFSVWLHWKNYRKPNQQRQVIRILWMVPIYGISTYISLVSLNVAFYVDTFRDIYEAFVIYAFFNLLLNKPPSQNFFPGTIFSREIFVGDPYMFLFVKRGILQFVYVKPVLAIITMILKATGNYHEVFAGIIPEVEHVSVAIQDFLVCIEMVPFAIAHSFSFSYEDYFDQNVHSARMPVRKAISDSFGLKDVMMDTLDTLRGSGISYRSFEPSEGVPHMGSSRTSRIMAGLRYSNMTTKKHWLEPAPTSRFLNSSRGMNEGIVPDHDSEPLEFDDPDSTDEMEILYDASRKMVFGDYNYPVIDFRVPLWRQARRDRRLQRYGGIGTMSRDINTKLGHGEEESLLGTREGCIDVIVKQGKGNYVVVDDLSDEDVQVIKKPPSPPIRKPTLSNIHRKPSASASTPILTTTTPTTSTTAPTTPTTTSTTTTKKSNQRHIPKETAASSSSSSNQFVQPSFSTPHIRYPNNSIHESGSSFTPEYTPESRSIHPTTTNTTASTARQISPSEQDAPLWQWPDQFPTTAHSSYTDNDDDLLSGDVWK
ncbi:hypothetical protein INT48_007528 [Thamnidium elegans]|uniref:DUF300-domain-containing protein n=1 Tax=Thamnidium elegans TaxID=101142 RepID=A0A8H7VSH8_9FUNG|nr:hypothetical protein INT48_007528 [Thamnidium elegans]